MSKALIHTRKDGCGHKTFSVTPELSIGLATTPYELEAYYRIRKQIFVSEQGIYTESDRDLHDRESLPIVANVNGEVVGTVRCYRMREGLWYGGRLAVLPEHRNYRIAAGLVRTAVKMMQQRSDVNRFLATVQVQNVRFFQKLGWKTLGHTIVLNGVHHRLMEYVLDR